MMNLNLDVMDSQISDISIESLMIDFIDSENDFFSNQQLFDSIEKLEFIKDQIKEYGITSTIRDMIGDQIQYTSNEDLIEKIDIAIENLISKITGDTIDKTLKTMKQLAQYLLQKHSYPRIHDEDFKVKFFDITDIEPFKKLIEDSGKAIESAYVKLNEKDVNSENISKILNMFLECISTGKELIKSFQFKEMTYSEYDRTRLLMMNLASSFMAEYRKFRIASMFQDKTKFINNLIKYGPSHLSSKDRKVYKETDKNQDLSRKINIHVRGILRILKIILSKIFVTVKQIDNQRQIDYNKQKEKDNI